MPERNYEVEAEELGFIRYVKGQDVTPPDDESEWWYHRDHPDGDWYPSAKEAVEDQ